MVRTIIFDYDGVLVDSFGEVYEVYKIIGKELGITIPGTLEQFRSLYGADYRACYRNLGLSEERQGEASEIFRREVGSRSPGLFPGIREAVDAVAKRWTAAVVSLNFEEEIRRSLSRFGILDRFDTVAGQVRGQAELKKDDEFRRVMQHQGVGPDEVIAVGDMTGDYEAARICGIERIVMAGYGWGFDRGKVPASVPVAESPGELLPAIERLAESGGMPRSR